jgi:hypothetical protein
VSKPTNVRLAAVVIELAALEYALTVIESDYKLCPRWHRPVVKLNVGAAESSEP